MCDCLKHRSVEMESCWWSTVGWDKERQNFAYYYHLTVLTLLNFSLHLKRFKIKIAILGLSQLSELKLMLCQDKLVNKNNKSNNQYLTSICSL